MTGTTREISPVMQLLARYISGALRKPLPKEVLDKTKHHVLDTLAAMVSGSRLLPGRKAITYVRTRGGTKEACAAGSRIDICMQHMCALMLTDGYVTFESAHDNKRMKDRKVLAMRRRIELVADEELEKLRPQKHAIVEMALTDGRQLRHHTRAVRGTAQNPMTRAEVDEKCHSLITPILGRKRARALCECVWGMEKLPNTRALRQFLTTRVKDN